MRDEIQAAIVAGGKSLRFGSPKLLAGYRNKRLIDIALEKAAELSTLTAIISSGQMTFDIPDIDEFTDVYPDKGPLGGIYTALVNAKRGWVAILPGDMPFLQKETYEVLWRSRDGMRPVVAVSKSGMEPMVSIWPVSCARQLERFLLSNVLKMHLVLDKCQAGQIDIAAVDPSISDRCFVNINRVEDLEGLVDS